MVVIPQGSNYRSLAYSEVSKVDGQSSSSGRIFLKWRQSDVR